MHGFSVARNATAECSLELRVSSLLIGGAERLEGRRIPLDSALPTGECTRLSSSVELKLEAGPWSLSSFRVR